jgi:type III secretory pathway component EscT
MVFILVINSALLGLLAAAITNVFSASIPLAVGLGLLVSVVYFAFTVRRGNRRFFATMAGLEQEFPAPA